MTHPRQKTCWDFPFRINSPEWDRWMGDVLVIRIFQMEYEAQRCWVTCLEAKRVPVWNAQRASMRGPPSRKGSLSIEDTFESISELGPLELMGRELDLAPYGTLRKSQSADSLNSISSVSNTFGQDFTLGQVEVSMEYNTASHTLHVAVMQGKDLLEREEASFESCFMRVSLLPDEQIVGISRIQRNAYSIFFDEKFSIPLDPTALEEKSLRFSVFGIDEDEHNVSTGVVELKLSVLDLPLQPFSGWLYLQDQNKAADAVGEILLSLSYLPTAERLTVVVVKAKNLIWTNDKTTADPFVKVYLLQDGRKMSKKKTAVKRDDPNPVFNEAMIFSVPAIVLQGSAELPKLPWSSEGDMLQGDLSQQGHHRPRVGGLQKIGLGPCLHASEDGARITFPHYL
ncbi:synaptotagmin-12 isoform X4 [Hylobates moloch]|uniref:synaptotagmin-12 isoform X4 n=1 Tax=Hylobates moloch TaxID=81572 RepID=UPI002674C75E|nr:synaptotagmin-12 isoform X4 [Hylobates moloch]